MISHEIAACEEAERALAVARDELARATRALNPGELAAQIAHEINQPLAAMVANGHAGLRWLGRPTPDLPKARAAITAIVADGLRAGEVIARVRTLVRKAPAHPERLDINEVVQHALHIWQAGQPSNAFALRVELTPLLPPVYGDAVQLQQVMLNLTVNAAEAMQGVSGPERELTISTGLSSIGDILVQVSDTGSGFDADAARQLFDAFYTTKAEGMGLGLTITLRIIEAHGGKIWAVRRAGRGATLAFSLPAHLQSTP